MLLTLLLHFLRTQCSKHLSRKKKNYHCYKTFVTTLKNILKSQIIRTIECLHMKIILKADLKIIPSRLLPSSNFFKRNCSGTPKLTFYSCLVHLYLNSPKAFSMAEKRDMSGWNEHLLNTPSRSDKVRN